MPNTQLQTKNTQILRIEDDLDIEKMDNSHQYRIILNDIIEQKQTIKKLLELVRNDDLAKYSSSINTCLKILKVESKNIKILESNVLYGIGLTAMLATDFITRSGIIQSNSVAQSSLTGASTTLFATLLNSIKIYTRKKTVQLGIARNLMSEYESLLIKILDRNSVSKSTKDHKTLARKIIAGEIKKELSEMQISADDAQNIVEEFKYSVMQTEPESYRSIIWTALSSAGIYIMSNLKFNNETEKTKFITAAALAIACTYMIHSEYSKFQDKSHKFKYTIMLTDIINDAIASSNVIAKQNSQVLSDLVPSKLQELKQEGNIEDYSIINKSLMSKKVSPSPQEQSPQRIKMQESIDDRYKINDLESNIPPKKAASDPREGNWQEVIDMTRKDKQTPAQESSRILL